MTYANKEPTGSGYEHIAKRIEFFFTWCVLTCIDYIIYFLNFYLSFPRAFVLLLKLVCNKLKK